MYPHLYGMFSGENFIDSYTAIVCGVAFLFVSLVCAFAIFAAIVAAGSDDNEH